MIALLFGALHLTTSYTVVVQQMLLPKVCGKAQGLSSQWKGGLHIYALLLLEHFKQRGSCMEQLSVDCSQLELGISQYSLGTLPQLQSKFDDCLHHRRGEGGTAANKNCILEYFQWLVILTMDWRQSSSTMGYSNTQCTEYLTLTTSIDPWCTTASSISMQISGFLLF